MKRIADLLFGEPKIKGYSDDELTADMLEVEMRLQRVREELARNNQETLHEIDATIALVRQRLTGRRGGVG